MADTDTDIAIATDQGLNSPIHPTSATSTRERDHDVDGPSEAGDPSVSVPQPNPSAGEGSGDHAHWFRCDGCDASGPKLAPGPEPVVPSARVDLDEIAYELHLAARALEGRPYTAPEVFPQTVEKLAEAGAALVAEVRRLRTDPSSFGGCAICGDPTHTTERHEGTLDADFRARPVVPSARVDLDLEAIEARHSDNGGGYCTGCGLARGGGWRVESKHCESRALVAEVRRLREVKDAALAELDRSLEARDRRAERERDAARAEADRLREDRDSFARMHARAIERYDDLGMGVMQKIADRCSLSDVLNFIGDQLNECDHVDDESIALWKRASVAATEVGRVREALQAIRDLHNRIALQDMCDHADRDACGAWETIDGEWVCGPVVGDFCSECWEDHGGGERIEWPCATVRALDAALDGNEASE